MSTYAPQAGVFPGRPPCASCGADFHLHRPRELRQAAVTGPELVAAAEAGQLECPEAYRPASLEVAQRELEAAEASGDAARVFVARGNLQRLGRK